MLVDLLGHSHPPGLQVPVVEVGLNQHVHGHLLDDIVVHGESGTVCEFQVKETVAVTAGDREFVDFLIQALETMKDREEAVSRGELALGLIAEGHARVLDELRRLARTAGAHSQYNSCLTRYCATDRRPDPARHRESRLGGWNDFLPLLPAAQFGDGPEMAARSSSRYEFDSGH